ncbi:MAG: ChaN family lipoprotein [Thermodesulfobacteriota bacterium]
MKRGLFGRGAEGSGWGRSSLRLAAVLLIAFVLSGCRGERVVRLSDNTDVDPAEIAGELAGVRIVFVGEHHDDKRHHAKQLTLIKALHDAGYRVAVGLEMFRAEDQEALDRWVAGEMEKDEFVDAYYGYWTIPFSQYADIFDYARDEAIPLVGLNIPKEIIHQVFEGGFESLSPDQLAEMPGVSCDIDPEYEAFIKKAMGRHEASDPSYFKSFCEAQMVWDTSMAHRIIEYLKANPDRVLVVLAGSVHSWKRGIPSQVSRRSDFKYVVILPESPDELSFEEITFEDADYLWLLPSWGG